MYNTTDKLIILSRCRYIRIVKNKNKLKENDVYIPIKKNGKVVYIVAVRD